MSSITNTDQNTLDVLNNLLAKNQKEVIEKRESTTPFTGEESFTEGGYYPEMKFLNVDRMETPITEEEKENPIVIQVVESDEYKNATSSGARNAMIKKAIESSNTAIFESKGEPTMFKKVRTQSFKNQDGEPRKYIVPKPAESNAFQRGFGGAILNTVKGLSGGIEKGFNIPFTNKRTPGTDDFITDPETNYIAENFPTYPSANAIEKAVQDVVPIIAGAAVGGKGVDKIDEVLGGSKKLANWISKQWDEVKKIDPKNAKQKLEMMLRGLFIERGANLGATLATPKDMEPLIGDDVLEFVGIDSETNSQLGHYIDNEAFTALGRVAIKTLGAGASWVGQKIVPKLSKNSSKREAEIGMLLLKQIDEGITDDLPGEILAERARILGQVVLDNKDFQLGILGQKIVKNADGTETIVDILPGNALQLDTGTSLAIGARDYVEQAYGWMKATKSPEEYERLVDQYAQSIIDNIVGLKQGRRGNRVVQAGEASINADASRVLSDVADEAIEGGSVQANVSGRLLAQNVLEPVEEALSNVQSTRLGVEVAERVSDATQDKDTIIGMLNRARDESSLGNTSTDMQTFQQLTGDDLFKGWEASYNKYNNAFETLPDDIPVDMEDLKNLIESVSKQTNDFDFVTTATTKQDPFSEMLKGLKQRVLGKDADGKAIMETGPEVLDRLSDIDLKWLYTNLRPEISRRLNALEASGAPTSKPLVQLKEWIDGAAETSGQTEFRAAMDMYEDHAATYLRTDELAQWEAKARKVRAKEVAPGVRMGQEDAYELGMQALNIAEQAATTGKLEAFLNALTKSSGREVSTDMAQAYVAMAIRGLTKSTEAGGKVSAAQVRESIQPYIKQLEATNPDAVKLFEDTVSNLEMVELGLTSAKQANAIAEQAYQSVLKEAQENAASKFINNLSGSNPSVMSDPSEVFRTIFNSKNAPDALEDLMRQADEIGNPLIRDGLKSKYVSYIKDRIYTNKRIASEVSTDGVGATRELSPTQLTTILGEEFDNTLSTLKVVFKDEPQKAEAITHLLEVLDVAVNNRALRGNNFGSSTVLDEKLKEKMNRIIVLTLGVLNPVATKARTLSAAMVDGRSKQIAQAIESQIDSMVTSPQYFDQVMKAVAKDATGNPLLKLLEQNMIRSGVALNKERSIETLEAVPPEFQQ